MKILITGGGGYVGSACLRYVAAQGHEVMAYDNLMMGHRGAVDGHALVVGDIVDTDLVVPAFAEVAEMVDRAGACVLAQFGHPPKQRPDSLCRNWSTRCQSLQCPPVETGKKTPLTRRG